MFAGTLKHSGDIRAGGASVAESGKVTLVAQKEAIVLRVKPGVTGIWQVTTRNESTFEERVNLDVEYVRNWTPWLDLYILARTVPVVVGGTGS